MSRGPSFRKHPFDWVHFVARRSESGRSWVRHYRAQPARRIREWTRESLLRLQKGDAAGGKAALDSIRDTLAADEDMPPSLHSVMNRWFYGARAYYFYCRDEFDRAEDDLRRAERAVVEAIHRDRFLVPLAQESPDFPHQRIRIARSRRRWREMGRYIEIERGMMANEMPLCTLPDGTSIDYSTLGRLYRQVPKLTSDESAFLNEFLDDELRLQAFERAVPTLYALPGFVVPCP